MLFHKAGLSQRLAIGVFFVLSEQSGNQWRRAGDVRLRNDFVKEQKPIGALVTPTDTHDLNHIPIAGWPASWASAIADGYGYNAYGEALLNRGRDTRQIWITALDGRQHDYEYPQSKTLSDANPRLQAYGAEWRARVPDEDEFISSVMDSFARTFSMIQSVTYPEKDALDSFFFEGRVGYCSYFATTLATILSGLGLEAHVVTGYMGGEWNLYGNYWLVNQSDAHAWVEVKRQDGLAEARSHAASHAIIDSEISGLGVFWRKRFRWAASYLITENRPPSKPRQCGRIC